MLKGVAILPVLVMLGFDNGDISRVRRSAGRGKKAATKKALLVHRQGENILLVGRSLDMGDPWR